MITYAKVVYSSLYEVDMPRRSEVNELASWVIFCRREYEHFYRDRGLVKDANLVICDEIETETASGEHDNRVIHAVHAKIGKITRHFNFTNVIRAEVDTED